MTEYIKNQLIKLCDNPEWFNDMLNTWDFKPEKESQAIKEYLSHVLLNGKLENTHIERIELQGRMVSAFIFDIPKDPLYFYVIVGVLDQNHNLTCVLLRNMKPTITINDYPIGWEWLDKVPLEDFTWLIEIFVTMTDNTDTYDFATFDKEATNGEPPYPVIEINRKGLANFLNEDQGYEMGISMYGHYIACKCLDISSEEEYMNQYTDIRILTNELEPC